MAGYNDLCGEITAGYDFCGAAPSAPGLDNFLYGFNKDEFTITYDADNPLIVTGLTAIGSAVLYKIRGAGDSFDASSTLQQKNVGPRFAELVMFNMASNSTTVKKFVVNAGSGRVGYIVVNNDKSTDSAIELYGATVGMKLTDNTVRKASDEDFQGGWKFEAGPPKGLLEPLPPRAVAIPGVSGPATYATTLAALEALLTP